MNAHEEYTFTRVRGVNTIVWKHLGTLAKSDRAIKKTRKKLKDKVGLENKDLPMLDIRQAGTELQFCDIIMCTDDVSEWEIALKKHYSTRVESKSIRAGKQLTILKLDKNGVFVTVNIYPSTKKLMVQPGEYDEAHLLDFLDDLHIIASKRPSVVISAGNTPDASAQLDSNVTLRSGSVSVQTTTSSSTHTDSVQPATSSPIVTVPATTLLSMPTVCVQMATSSYTPIVSELTATSSSTTTSEDGTSHVNIETSFTSDVPHVCYSDSSVSLAKVSTSVSAVPTTNIGTQTHANNMIVDELLCFVQNRMNVLHLDMIIKLVTDFYAASVIYVSKQLIFDILKPVNQRFVKRRGGIGCKEDVMDICKLMLATETGIIPTFIARDLSNLPPLCADNFDMSKLLKEIQTIKATISCLVQSHTELADTVKTVHFTERQVQEETQSSQGVSADGQAAHASIKKNCACSPSMDDIHEDSDDMNSLYLTIDCTVGCDDSESENNTSYHVPVKNTFSPLCRSFAQVLKTPPSYDSVQYRPLQSSPKEVYTKPAFKIPVVHGMGSYSTLKSIQRAPVSGDRNTSVNRHITGLFITRLDPRTTAKQLELHLKRETGVIVRVEKLRTKYPTYSSFYIRCDGKTRSLLWESSLWPQGSMVKPYFNEL
jgi:hypothetical protein